MMSCLSAGGHKSEKEEEVGQLMVDVKRLSSNKDQLEEQIKQIEEVTKERDGYFNSLVQRIQQSETVSEVLTATVGIDM